MKKVITSIAFVLFCAISANAQDKKQVATAAATVSSVDDAQEAKNNLQQETKKKAYEIVTFLKLDENQTGMFYELLMGKNDILSNTEISQDRKDLYLKQFTEKMSNVLDAKYWEKLKTNKELYNLVFGAMPKTKK